jgi:hypothetical protein
MAEPHGQSKGSEARLVNLTVVFVVMVVVVVVVVFVY